ncbi:hypothetical protein IQ254_29685 [Nodosilinea sp. LEGE 07088]|nr:hypothetical protein [Nodosilinea sp. LEGE 07088]
MRLRTPKGQRSDWRDYKAVNLHQGCVAAFFRQNDALVEWINQQPLASPVVCLGDGHDGIWNLFAQIAPPVQRLEILDWYHLIENLGQVGGSQHRLDAVETCLWRGDLEGAVRQFDDWPHEQVDRFIAYLAKHRHRIVNYAYYQAEGMSIGSCVFAARGQLSQRSSKLDVESRFQELTGTKITCNKCCDSDVLI